ncbi:TetR/AcrR family transcriptional regulator [Kitasatospora sp. NPDC097643]|uniref:TetR/AcrR family transcriptional regulator n=1 Tax=Kitasatospora sp. NPDC097643 TaxID=3157230 RepID=UPI0033247BB5
MDESPVPAAGNASDVPTPPWLQPERAPRRMRMPLSQEAVVDAALRVITEDGLDRLTMRAVAQRLDVTPGALYVHVRNKDELLQLTLDRVMAELSIPEPDPKRWTEQIKEFARNTRELLSRYPAVARMSFGQIPSGPNAVVVFEQLLAILTAGGLPGRAAAYAADLVSGYVKSSVYEATVWTEADKDGKSVEDRLAQAREYLGALPAEAFPNLTKLAGPMFDASPDERFEFGLDVLVGGLSRMTGQDTPPD